MAYVRAEQQRLLDEAARNRHRSNAGDDFLLDDHVPPAFLDDGQDFSSGGASSLAAVRARYPGVEDEAVLRHLRDLPDIVHRLLMPLPQDNHYQQMLLASSNASITPTLSWKTPIICSIDSMKADRVSITGASKLAQGRMDPL